MKNFILAYIQNGIAEAGFKRVANGMGMAMVTAASLDEMFQVTSYSLPSLFVIESFNVDDTITKAIRILKKNPITKDIPILAIHGALDDRLTDQLIGYGVSELVFFPCPDSLIELRVKSISRASSYSRTINELMQSRMKELQDFQSVMIESLATIAEYRDPETGEHIKRTQSYVKALAQTLMKKGLFLDELNEENVELMYLSVPLHDIGKVGIPDEVLLKPGKLTTEEFELIKTHTIIGHEALMRTGNKIRDNTFLRYADDVAYTHQEKYDGSGYPRGLKGDEIPLIGRLMAVADVYDALISKRVYKEAFPHEEAMAFIVSGAGTHFDPVIAMCAKEIEFTFRNIALTYQDTSTDKRYPDRLHEYAKEGIIHTILVVDDSRVIRSILKNQLINIGFKVDEAENGLEGLMKVKENHYDLIMTDVEMPKMDGYEFTRKASEYLGKDARIIIMTASDYDATEQKLKEFGAKGILLKPVEMNRLEKKLSIILNDVEMIDQNRLIEAEHNYLKAFCQLEEDVDVIRFTDPLIHDLYAHNFIYLKTDFGKDPMATLRQILKEETGRFVVEGSPDSYVIPEGNWRIRQYDYFLADISIVRRISGRKDCHLRKLNKELLPHALELDLKIGAEGGDPDFIRRRFMRLSHEYLTPDSISRYLLESDEGFIGYGDVYQDGHVVKVEEFHILSGFRLKRFGATLLKLIAAEFIDKGATHLYFVSDHDDPSIAMYGKCGFKVAGSKMELRQI